MAFQLKVLLLSCLYLQYYFLSAASSSNDGVYSVVELGAKKGGEVDSTKSFLQAWGSSCGSTQPATVHVPEGEFLLGPVLFKGPCKSKEVKFQIDGTIVAPKNSRRFSNSSYWIKFSSVDNLMISGGTIDGRGKFLWRCKAKGKNNSCPSGPRSLDINNGNNITIQGLKSLNSQNFHMWIHGCSHVNVTGVKLIAPEKSQNTDGIHIQKASDIIIYGSMMKTGDDCISIGPATTNLLIKNVYCGPGHGISIGSLGNRKNDDEMVKNITVDGVVFNGTQNGLRIKTWGRPSGGIVCGIVYNNITMRNVKNPIVITQNYCPGGGCPIEGSKIKIKDISYSNIHGTSSTEVAMNFDCSPIRPCSGITLKDVKLTHGHRRHAYGDHQLAQEDGQQLRSVCKHAKGIAHVDVTPSSCF